jgi:adenylate kinase
MVSASLNALSKTKWVSNLNCNSVTFLVDDDIVIKLVKSEIDRAEEAHQSWLITGFPRTKV